MLMRVWSNRNSHSLLVRMQNGRATWEDNVTVSYKFNIILPTRPNTFIVIYSNELKHVHTKTCT